MSPKPAYLVCDPKFGVRQWGCGESCGINLVHINSAKVRAAVPCDPEIQVGSCNCNWGGLISATCKPVALLKGFSGVGGGELSRRFL